MKNYSEIANELIKKAEIKVKTAYVNDFNYSDSWVYLPRVYSSNYQKAKVRMLSTGTDKVKNCIKITYNPDRYTKQEIESKIKSVQHLIKYHLHGSCQNFLSVRNLVQLLTIYDSKNKIKESAKNTLQLSK